MTAPSRTARAVVWVIEIYRHTVSPLRLPTCRFTPTCSQYAVDAVTEFGVLRGGWLALVRLVKCGPWHGGGWDPIPDRVSDRDSHSDTTGVCGCESAERRDGPVQQGKSQLRV
ncbi:membrane protein insertion efficiency factor YidD [Mycobacterium sp. Y57]|uniref:membrane protein insertion efficiency factor YidD n=1 Tax=Mycolicibacterium xanthum TaxID=2796469 RepID=UPI001C848679|nr:membrane protein insertion efficiency factor YidD [Mycolicibacterium xanthum]MBX7433737.1 membrane protein insertion efficiency factor YidD [Mycolicibacterium xanthum]